MNDHLAKIHGLLVPGSFNYNAPTTFRPPFDPAIWEHRLSFSRPPPRPIQSQSNSQSTNSDNFPSPSAGPIVGPSVIGLPARPNQTFASQVQQMQQVPAATYGPSSGSSPQNPMSGMMNGPPNSPLVPTIVYLPPQQTPFGANNSPSSIPGQQFPGSFSAASSFANAPNPMYGRPMSSAPYPNSPPMPMNAYGQPPVFAPQPNQFSPQGAPNGQGNLPPAPWNPAAPQGAPNGQGNTPPAPWNTAPPQQGFGGMAGQNPAFPPPNGFNTPMPGSQAPYMPGVPPNSWPATGMPNQFPSTAYPGGAPSQYPTSYAPNTGYPPAMGPLPQVPGMAPNPMATQGSTALPGAATSPLASSVAPNATSPALPGNATVPGAPDATSVTTPLPGAATSPDATTPAPGTATTPAAGAATDSTTAAPTDATTVKPAP